MPRRSRDQGLGLGWYMKTIDVCCPRCSRRAEVREASAAGAASKDTQFRLVCGHCGLYRTQALNRSVTSNTHLARDPFFGLPLWLATSTRHGALYAFNREHLDAVQDYVSATLRERHTLRGDMLRNATMQSRLPRWIKIAANRDDIVKALNKLQIKAASD